MKTKSFLLAAALAAVGISTASAADLPRRAIVKAPPSQVVAPYNWSGVYIGVHGGGAWGTAGFVDVTDPVGIFSEGEHDVSGWLIGGQVGFNYQVGAWVWGVEAQGSWADISGDHITPQDNHLSTDVEALGTLAGRIGYTFNNVLVYAKGGAAWIREEHNWSAEGIAAARISDTRWGWMVGGGLEFGFAPNWSLALEYNYMDFGTETYNNVACPPCEETFNEDIDQQIHVVKVGINYRFNASGPVVARY